MNTKKRRDFLKGSMAAAAGLGLMAGLSSCNKNAVDLSKMFVHHAFIWFKEPGNKDVFEKVKQGLEQLVTIETIRYKHIGVPVGSDREVIDNSYQFSLLVIFDDVHGHDIYQEHEKHINFIEECSGYWERVVVYDSCDC